MALGQTPVVRSTGGRFSINMLSAISAQGRLSFLLHQGRGNSAVFIDFCRRLLADDGGTVFLVLDNHSIHKSREVNEFLATTDGRLRLFFLWGAPRVADHDHHKVVTRRYEAHDSEVSEVQPGVS